MTRYRLDTLKGRVVAFTCKGCGELDDRHQNQHETTHFDSHADALAALVSSLRYQVMNAATTYRQKRAELRKSRRELVRVTDLFEKLGGLKP